MALAVQAIENAYYRPVLGTNPAHPNDWPVRLIVSSQTEARHNRALWAPTHLVSIRAPATRLLSMIDLPPERHLELRFGDTIDPVPRMLRVRRRSRRRSPSSTACQKRHIC